MNNQLSPEEILNHFNENADYQWLCSHISLINESIRKDNHIDSLLYYVDSLREALSTNSPDLKYYRHFQCYEEILCDLHQKIKKQIYDPFDEFEDDDADFSALEDAKTSLSTKKKKDGSRLSKKNISDEKVQLLYADAIKDINSMQMDIFDFI